MTVDKKKYFESLRNSLTAKNYSKRTISNYVSSLNKFFDEFDGNIQRATVAELTAYIATVNSSRSAMAQMYGALQNFYKHVLKQPKKFPFIPYPKKEKKVRDIPTHEQVLAMIDLTNNVKHKFIISFLYGTGVRLEELVTVKWKDIQRTKEINPLVVKIHGKGNKERPVPVSESLYKLLMLYCKTYKLTCATDNEQYVLGNDKKYSMTSVNRVVKAAAIRAGIPFEMTPHKLRHAYGLYQHRINKIELANLGVLMGHESGKTTMIYAAPEIEKFKTPI